MIDLIDVSKAYTLKGVRKPILNRLTYRFPRDRNVAIAGPNGAGKSTLMRLIAGAELPDAGQINREGRTSWPLGFAGGFNGSMTGIENVRFVSRIYGEHTADVLDYVRSFSELGASLNLPIRSYSNGMKARLAFGLSMAIDFDCYLIDEITAVGDEAFRAKSQQVFETKLARSQIIMISHSSETLKAYCDCGLLLAPDGVFYFDTIDALINEYSRRFGSKHIRLQG